MEIDMAIEGWYSLRRKHDLALSAPWGNLSFVVVAGFPCIPSEFLYAVAQC
jgi:hypothetical protein